MKLILIPLAVLIMLSILSMSGLGEGDFGALSLNQSGVTADTILYTSGGHPTVYANGTAIGEQGKIIEVEGVSGVAHWYNSSGTYLLYTDVSCSQIAKSIDTVAPMGGGSWSWTGQLTGSLGLMVLVGGLMILVTVLGARFLSYGQSEIGVDAIYKTSGYVAIWGVFSVLALSLMLSSSYTSIIYFILTVIYTLGIINSVGHPSGDV